METKNLPHQMILQERETLSVSGVSDVDSFDEDSMIVYTSMGELTVKGASLRVQKLDVAAGELTLSGRIDALSYGDIRTKKKGVLGRIFS